MAMPVRAGRSRIHHREAVERELKVIQPSAVVGCVGVGGTPSATWHNLHETEVMQGNLIGPLVLADVCHEQRLHCLVLGSGVVHSETRRPSDEVAPLSPVPSAYGRIRAQLEAVLSPYLRRHVLLLRFMYPVSADGDGGCLLSKLASATRIHDTPSSLTILPDLLPWARVLLGKRVTGVLNFVNPGLVSPRLIVHEVLHRPSVPVVSKDESTAACWLAVDRLQSICDTSLPDCKSSLLALAGAVKAPASPVQ